MAATSTQVNVTFANTRPAPNLASNIQMDSTLGRLAVNGTTGESNATRVSISLSSPMDATLQRPNSNNVVRICLMPAVSAQPVVSMVGSALQTLGDKPAEAIAPEQPASESSPHLYDLDAFGSDAAALFKSLATQSNTNIVLVGDVSNKVTVHFARVPIDRAIDLLAKAAGLDYIKDGNAYVVGSTKDLATEYPDQSSRYNTEQKVYECKYVDAAALAASILTVYDKKNLQVTVGAMERSTTMLGSSASGSMGGSMSGGSSAGYSGGAVSSGASSSTGGVSTISMSGSPSAGGVGTSSTNTGRESREVILSGDEALVDQAYALAEQLDRRRKQVKIDVNITDVSLDNLKNLGIQWSFPQFGVHEGTPSGFSFGSFKRDPLNFEATMSALMDQNKAKLLAAPSIALLDGEQGYILIGQRVSYPLLTGYTQAQTPIFSVGQEEVGIYLQVKAQMTGEDEIMLSVYPQVSFITGYLNVNGASYPQVSTREQQTTIRVESGGKVVIGGLINDEDIRDEQNVPILSKIPFFGELFKYRNTHKTRDEVIMTITPQIISD
jgi:type II secretory pathway component GspD/PulD (secretin)